MGKIKKICSSELSKGSFTLLILFGVFNFFHTIFHFVGARLLGAEDYGILATILGISFILGIPSEAIQTIISSYTTKFQINREYSKIKNLIKKSYRKLFFVSLISVVFLTIASPFIGSFLSIDYKLILLLNFLLVMAFILPINRGVLQGQKKFFKLGISLVAESLSKLVLMIILVLIGWRVYGAMTAIIMGFLISFVISIFFINKILKVKVKGNSFSGIYSYSWIVLITTGCLILFYSVDIILAKRFFSSIDVGLYAAISVLGKTLFWLTSPVSKAMFPLVSEKREKDKCSKDIVKESLLIVSCLCLVGIFIFGFFPEMLIKILYGSTYLKYSNLLVYLGIAMSLLALTNIFIFDAISNKRKISLFLILFVILQVILLSLFHNTIFQFVLILMIANSITLLFFFFDYLRKVYSK